MASLARVLAGQGRGPRRAQEEAPSGLEAVRLPRSERLLAADSTEYVLERGRKCVIFQLQDDHSRLAVAWLVARAETSDAAVRVLRQGRARLRRAPAAPDRQRGLVEPHPQGPAGPAGGSRQSAGRGAHHRQALQAHHPGQERALPPPPCCAGTGKQPPPRHRRRAPRAQVDTFDRIYNTERPHQSLPGRATPAQAWDATEVAQAPRPPHDDPPAQPARPPRTPRPRGRDRIAPTGTKRTTIGRNGTISLAGTAYLVSSSRAGQEALITWDAHRITITDPHGEVLTQYPWPQPGTRYVSHHDPATRATRGGRPRKTPRNVTDVLTHQPSPMS